jgi:aspartate ammonia-lyase
MPGGGESGDSGSRQHGRFRVIGSDLTVSMAAEGGQLS